MMRRAVLGIVSGVMLGLIQVPAPSRGQEAGIPVSEPATPPVSGLLDFSIRARALGLIPEPQPSGALGLEPMRAPTGAGTLSFPKAASGPGPRVYLAVPVCHPGAGERLYRIPVTATGELPEGRLRGLRPVPGLVAPSRPIP